MNTVSSINTAQIVALQNFRLNNGIPISMDWSPDGTCLVIGNSEGSVEMWTAEGNPVWSRRERFGPVASAVWSPNGREIAAISDRMNVMLFEATSGRMKYRVETEGGSWGVAWSPDSKRLAWVTKLAQGNHVIKIIDASTAQSVMDCVGHKCRVRSLSWSPSGNFLASGEGGENNDIRLWHTKDGSCVNIFKAHAADVTCLDWSRDGRFLASASKDKSIRVWSVENATCKYICQGHRNTVWSVSWSPAGQVLASGSADKTIRLWSADSGHELCALSELDRQVYCVTYASDDTRLATAFDDGTIRILKIPATSRTGKDAFQNMALNKYIIQQAATLGRRPNTIFKPTFVPKCHNATDDCLKSIRLKSKERDSFPRVGLSPDDRKMVIGHSDGQVRYWDMESSDELWEGGQQHQGKVTDVRIAPDGMRIASGSIDKTIRLWDADTGRCVGKYKEHKDAIKDVRWSPDGQRIASIEYSKEKSVHIWEADTGKCLQVLDGHSAATQGLAWSPDGRLLASGDNSSVIQIWDTVSGENLHLFECQMDAIWTLCWSPDSRFIAVAVINGSIFTIDASKGRIITQFRGNRKGDLNGSTALDWSPDGRFVAAGFRNKEKTIRIWDARTGEERKCFEFEEHSCVSLAWSSTGAFIITSSFNSQYEYFRIWDTRDLMPPQTAPDLSRSTNSSPSTPCRHLPFALSQLLRLNIHPPLSLIQNLMNLAINQKREPLLSSLMNTGYHKLTALRWPARACVGLIALLLKNIHFPNEFTPPPGTSPVEIRDAIRTALSGEPIEPQAPPPPIALLTEAATKIDDRLVTLLQMLGPDAVAADPGLPLKLLPDVKHLQPMTSEERHLLSLRISFSGASGQSVGTDPGADRGQVGGVEIGPLRSDWRSLLPSQLVMPGHLLSYRHLRGELLFRAREITEPPRLRPTVLLLDVSPPVFGPVESVTRLAAFAVARSLRQSGIPAVLITTGGCTGGGETVRELAHTADLVDIWTRRTLNPADPRRSLGLAGAIRTTLRNGGGPEPVILLLTQPWFGAEDALPKIQGLRGLFVQYPLNYTRPALAEACERWESVTPENIKGLENILGNLIG